MSIKQTELAKALDKVIKHNHSIIGEAEMNLEPLKTIDIDIIVYNKDTGEIEHIPTDWDIDTLYTVRSMDEKGNITEEATMCPIDLSCTIKDYLEHCMPEWGGASCWWEAIVFVADTTEKLGWSSSEI
jgi:hypothetical protein